MFFTLLVLAIELCEPSTNFVRVSSSKNLFQFNWSDLQKKQNSDTQTENHSNDTNQFKLTSPVYTCQIVEYFTFQIPQFKKIIGFTLIYPLKKQIHIEIFIPPKIFLFSSPDKRIV